MATLCLANGVPMITAGDERGRTQGGNNNAYCQDNDISWIDWQADGDPGAWLDVYEVTRTALALRRAHPALRQRHWFEGAPTIVDGPKDLTWLHPSGREMTEDDWHDTSWRRSRCGCWGRPLRSPGPRGEQQVDASFALWFNAAADPVDIVLPLNPWVQRGEVVLSDRPRARSGHRGARGRHGAPVGSVRRGAPRGLSQACGDDTQLGHRGQQRAARHHPHRVAEGARAGQGDVAVEAVATALVGLHQIHLDRRGIGERVIGEHPPVHQLHLHLARRQLAETREGADREVGADLRGVPDAGALDVLDLDRRPRATHALLPGGQLARAGVVGVQGPRLTAAGV